VESDMLWSIDALLEKWCEYETIIRNEKNKTINHIQCLDQKRKPFWLMLRGYDAKKHTSVERRDARAEWLHIK